MDYYYTERWSLVSYDAGGVGGPCTYSYYPGTATITAIQPADCSLVIFEAWFTFATDEQIAESWYVYDPERQYTLSSVYNAPQLMDQLFVKVGHVYPCTLSVITRGTCTPSIFTIGLPVEPVNQSTPWIEPDTVAENEQFELRLLDYRFSCNTLYSDMTGSVTVSGGVTLEYKAVENPLAGMCAPSAELYGITYMLDGLAAGNYPVYAVALPECYPVCDIAVLPELIDTLVVTRGTRALRPLSYGFTPASRGMITAEIFLPDGRLVGSVRSTDIEAVRICVERVLRRGSAGVLLARIRQEGRNETTRVLWYGR
jgi:hypothetical protein